MNLTLTSEQLALQQTVRRFAAEHASADHTRDLEKQDSGYDRSVWRDLCRLGWAGVALPAVWGGGGLSLFELALVIEALGQSAVPSPIFSTIVEAAPALASSGSRQLQAEWLPRAIAGDAILTSAVLEDSGELAASDLRLTITPSGAGVRLNGRKLFVRDAAAATAVIVFGRMPAGGVSAVLAPLPASGVSIERMASTGGEPLFALTFQEVEVAASQVLTPGTDAWPLAQDIWRRGAALKAAELSGIGQAVLDLTVQYSSQRVQFGRPIGSLQAVQHHAADMYRNLVSSRLLAYQAAEALANRPPADWQVSHAKAMAGDAILSSTRIAHQVHGGVGYYTSYPLELFTRHAIAANAAYGNSRYHRRQAATIMQTQGRGALTR